MSSIYHFSDGHLQRSIPVTSTDKRLIRAVVDATYPEPAPPLRFGPEEMAEYHKNNAFVRRILVWNGSHMPETVPRVILLEEITVVERELSANMDKYMYVYTHHGSFSMFHDGKEIPLKFDGTGMISGIRLNGDSDHAFTLLSTWACVRWNKSA